MLTLILQSKFDGERVQIKLYQETKFDFNTCAEEFLNETVYADWPHSIEGKVVGIVTENEARWSNAKNNSVNVADTFKMHVQMLNIR